MRTRRRLTEALIALTLDKGYEAVTIRDITEQAGVGYATFFRHYADKETLLRDVLEAFLGELLELVRPQSGQDPVETGTLIFEHARRNGELYRVLLDTGREDLLGRVYEVGMAGVLAANRPQANSVVPPVVAAHHVIASFLALLRWWLEEGMPYEPSKMGRIYSELIIRPTEEVAFGG